MFLYVFFNPFYNLIRVKIDRAIKIVKRSFWKIFGDSPNIRSRTYP